ncbi:MAG: alpha-N-acetylglucosaminidase [Oscillospiraceae bacterium]|jgi:alpha-N-acetylglucosaminidase|nr:alpha-N-acetylglucosaminidase [Oscillospiraceae bacterium]
MLKRLLTRHCPQWTDWFSFQPYAIPSGYMVQTDGACVTIQGGSLLAQAVGLRVYLERACGASFSLTGQNAFSFALPKRTKKPPQIDPVRGELKAPLRGCFSPLAYSYGMCWWDWARWELETDRLALYGVNFPLLLLGSDYVWYQTLRGEGMSTDYVLSTLSNPLYWPRQLMGQLDGAFPPVDALLLKSRAQLGKMVADRCREWGMNPILAGYTGIVSSKYNGVIKDARLFPVPSWNGFAAPRLIDPDSDGFARLGKLFTEKREAILGDCDYVFVDPFHGIELPEAFTRVLPGMAEAVAQAEDGRTIVQMGAQSQAVFTRQIKNRVITLGQSQDDVRYLTAVSSSVDHGQTVLHGDLRKIASAHYEKTGKCVGIGDFSDACETEPLPETLRLESLSRERAAEPELWLRGYAANRYGAENSAWAHALRLLADSCYGQSDNAPGSVFCMRPSTSLEATAPGNALDIAYDNARLWEAARLLAQGENPNAARRYDLCEVLRQAMDNQARDCYKAAMDGYYSRDPAAFERGCNTFLTLLEDCDRLLATVDAFDFHQHVARARDAAKLDAERNNYEFVIMVLHTLYGAAATRKQDLYLLHGLAWRGWSGLLGGYHQTRWRAFFSFLAGHFGERKDVKFETKHKPAERNAYNGNVYLRKMGSIERGWLKSYAPPEDKKEDTHTVAVELLAKYDGKLYFF